MSLVESWRRWQNFPEFSDKFQARAEAAAVWLQHMIEIDSGDGPNVGANDGANLLPLTDAGYRDFRPAVQLARALFSGQNAYSTSAVCESHLAWLQVHPPVNQSPKPVSRKFDDGGYVVLREGKWLGCLKYPRYKFRPHHCDALHLDLWHGSNNVLRDAGSYGYNVEAKWVDYFSGVSAHNTVSFDDHDQMPAVSRFLRGAWLETDEIKFKSSSGQQSETMAAYFDWRGCQHQRKVSVDNDTVVISDKVGGFKKSATLRWRLSPGNWTLAGGELLSKEFILRITANVDIERIEIVEGWESRYYLNKTSLPVLEVEVGCAGTITTEILTVEDDS